MTRRRRIAAVLVAAVRGDDPSPHLARGCPDGLVEMAARHGVAGHVGKALAVVADIPKLTRERLAAHARSAAANHLRTLGDLARIAPVLDAAGIDWAVVKGPAHVERLHGDPELRPYGDLDLLVRPGHFRMALDALERAEAGLIDANWDLLCRERRGQVHLRLAHGTVCDLHWHLINTHRERFALDTDAILDRRCRRDLAGIAAWVLDDADALVHSAVHAALAGGRRLIWCKDIELAARQVDLDTAAVRAAAAGASAPLAVMLDRAARIFGAPADGLLRVPTAARWAERMWPTERSAAGTAGVVALVSRTTGSSVAMRARVLARGGRIRLAGLTGADVPVLAAAEHADRNTFIEQIEMYPSTRREEEKHGLRATDDHRSRLHRGAHLHALQFGKPHARRAAEGPPELPVGQVRGVLVRPRGVVTHGSGGPERGTTPDSGPSVTSLHVDRVTQRFGAMTALDGVSMVVDRGSVHALLGPNGAGKTTLLRVLAGLTTPTDGSVAVDGPDGPTLVGQTTRCHVGVVHAGDRSFYLRLSGLENLMFFGRLRGMSKRDARAAALGLMEDLDLTGAAHRRVNTYSQGMIKRLGYARGLLGDPAVLLVDEATHDLDPTSARSVIELTSSIAAAGTIVIWATQRLEEIRGFAGSVTVLSGGRVSFDGSLEAFLRRSDTTAYTLSLRGSEDALGRLPGLLSPTARLTPTAMGHRLDIDAGVSLGDRLAVIHGAGVEVLACTRAVHEVESAFASVTGTPA